MKTNYTPNTSNLLKSSTALTEGSEDHSAQNRYSAFVMCNEAVALPPLPKKKDETQRPWTRHPKIAPVKCYLKNYAHKNKVWWTSCTSSNLQLVNRNLDELHDKYLEELISSEADSIMQLQSETKSTKARKTVCKITNKKLSASSRVKNETKGDQKLRIIIFNHYYDLIYQSLRRQILSWTGKYPTLY